MHLVFYLPFLFASVLSEGTLYFPWEVKEEFYQSLDIPEEQGGMTAFK